MPKLSEKEAKEKVQENSDNALERLIGNATSGVKAAETIHNGLKKGVVPTRDIEEARKRLINVKNNLKEARENVEESLKKLSD